MKGRCSMMKEKGQFKKKFVKKIATIMMAVAMVVSGGFGVAPAADHSVSVYATDNAYRGYHVTSTKTEKKPATSSTKKSKLSKNHANKTTKTEKLRQLAQVTSMLLQKTRKL